VASSVGSPAVRYATRPFARRSSSSRNLASIRDV